MNKGQLILGTEPAQKLHGPGAVAMSLQPDLLPVALVLAADLHRLTQGSVEGIQLLADGSFVQGGGRLDPSDQLPMRQQVRITADR